ncbi:MAG TPA: PIN domain-containing protein [Acidobacteriota bacterium]|jgi:hypothetical protein
MRIPPANGHIIYLAHWWQKSIDSNGPIMQGSIFFERIPMIEPRVSLHHLKPRDAIHAASALSRGIREIVSEDSDFDAIKELQRKSIRKF